MPRQERTKSGTGIYHAMYGMKNNGTFGLIDNLTVSYDGNQLVMVTDAAKALNYSDALDFHDGDDTACEYDYDSNGALTRDSNRGINGITYDYGHHPNYINMNMTSGPRNITNDYIPDGRKLLSKHVMSIPKVNGYIRKTITDMYIDGLMLRGDTTLLWRFDGGYVDLNANGTPTRWNYYIADHLGSTRMVVDSNDSIRETISYYPFGSEMRISNPAQMSGDTSHPFRFTGKELDRQNSLNMYDFGARMYDVAGVPMWTSVDPLAEKYYGISPYVYCENNPLRFIDPNGMWSWDSNGNLVAQKGDDANTMAKYLGTSSSNALQILNRCGVSANSNGILNLSVGQVFNKSDLWVGTKSKAGPVVNNTKEAIAHYYLGNGEAADVGDQSTKELLSSDKFQSKLNKIATQKVASEGYFSIDLTDKTFHIGHTNVDYKITSNGTSNSVTFTLFSKDGFWDPDFIDEKCLGKGLGVSFCQPDGMGPNLERGGNPYPYKTRTRTFFFKPIE